MLALARSVADGYRYVARVNIAVSVMVRRPGATSPGVEHPTTRSVGADIGRSAGRVLLRHPPVMVDLEHLASRACRAVNEGRAIDPCAETLAAVQVSCDGDPGEGR